MRYFYTLHILCLLMFSSSLSAAEVPATVSWADVRQLGLPLSGVIKSINKQSGSYVKTGEAILSLNCGFYNAQFNQKKAIAEGLLPAVERTLKDKDLAVELFERTVLSEIELRNAELIYIETKSKYDAAKAESDEKKWHVDNCNLIADSHLIVLELHASVGEVISLETTKPVLATVASREKMSATAVVTLPLKKNYKPGKKLKVDVFGKIYDGKIVSVIYNSDSSAELVAEFNVFDPRLITSKSAKLIIE